MELPFWSSGYVGTGAYRLRDFVPGVHAMLVKNPEYILGAPKIDEIEVKFIPDPSTLGANLLAGQVDLTLGGRLSLDWGTQVRDRWPNGRMVSSPPTQQISAWPQLLTPAPPLGHVETRRALVHAVDRQAIIDSLVAGLSPVAHSTVSPLDAEYRAVESSIVRYEYDRNRAAELIRGLGYAKGSDGKFQGPGGPLRVEIRARAREAVLVTGSSGFIGSELPPVDVGPDAPFTVDEDEPAAVHHLVRAVVSIGLRRRSRRQRIQRPDGSRPR